jgi:hypothetical protein
LHRRLILVCQSSSGLKFTQIALKRSQAQKDEELSVSFTKAYEETLKKHHSFVVKPIFAVSPVGIGNGAELHR